jgi:hypothetical protein
MVIAFDSDGKIKKVHIFAENRCTFFYCQDGVRRQTDIDDLATTTDIDVNAVGAMDVSRSGAQRSGDERNRPQRRPGDDRRYGRQRSRGDGCELERSAASGDERNRPQRRPSDDNGCRRQTLRKESSSFAQGTPILCAKDSNPLSKGLPSFARVVALSSLRAITFTPKLRCAPFRRSHPSPLLRSTSTSVVVARSSLRAITFVSARCASLQLTSIAPTPLDGNILGRRHRAVRTDGT